MNDQYQLAIEMRTGRPGDESARGRGAIGETPLAALQPRSWIWFQQNISPSMEHSQQKIYGDRPLSSIAQVLRFRYARSIAIVSTAGIEHFLSSVEKDFEDFQVAPITAM